MVSSGSSCSRSQFSRIPRRVDGYRLRKKLSSSSSGRSLLYTGMVFLPALPGVYSTTFPGQRGFFRAHGKFRCQNPFYQPALVFLACNGQFLFGDKRQKLPSRHPFQSLPGLLPRGGEGGPDALRPCGHRHRRGDSRGYGIRGCGLLPQHRRYVRRAHAKPLRLRRGVAARDLHGNTARRLRDGRGQPADNTLYGSGGRHGYGRT